jgi:hypothetical protein
MSIETMIVSTLGVPYFDILMHMVPPSRKECNYVLRAIKSSSFFYQISSKYYSHLRLQNNLL